MSHPSCWANVWAESIRRFSSPSMKRKLSWNKSLSNAKSSFIFNKHLSFASAKGSLHAKPRRKHHVTVTTLALGTLGHVGKYYIAQGGQDKCRHYRFDTLFPGKPCRGFLKWVSASEIKMMIGKYLDFSVQHNRKILFLTQKYLSTC